MEIIPSKSLFHFIALLPKAVEPRRFFEAVHRRPAGLVIGKEWTAVAQPRPVAFGPITDEAWRWRVVIDVGPLPQSSWQPGFGDAKPPPHAAHAFVFLLNAPEDASGLDRVRATLDIGKAWLEAGASALAFPSGGVVNEEEMFKSLEPASVDADGAAALLLSFSLIGRAKDGRVWLRTRGLGQFGLPDLCSAVAGPQPAQQDVQNVQTMFAVLAPHLIATDKRLGAGEEFAVGDRLWKAGSQQDLRTTPESPGELQAMLPVQFANA